MSKTTPHEPGDQVKVLDTSNQRRRVGYLKSFGNNGEVYVYMVRFDTIMKFGPDDKTGMGRFRIIGLRRPK